MAAIKQHTPGAKQKRKIVAEDGEDAYLERSHESCELCEELELVVSLDPEKYFQVGRSLDATERAELISFLVNNLDIFTWDPYEVSGVDLSYIQHRLNVDPPFKPVQ